MTLYVNVFLSLSLGGRRVVTTHSEAGEEEEEEEEKDAKVREDEKWR